MNWIWNIWCLRYHFVICDSKHFCDSKILLAYNKQESKPKTRRRKMCIKTLKTCKNKIWFECDAPFKVFCVVCFICVWIVILIGDDMIVYNITPNELMNTIILFVCLFVCFFLFFWIFHFFFNRENRISTQTKDFCEMALIFQISKKN